MRSHLELAFRFIAREIASFHPRTLPPMLRASYARELLAFCCLPFMLAAVEAGAMGNIVRKLFDQATGVSTRELNFAVACVVAAPALSNIISFVWAGAAWGKGKIRFIVGLQLATAICVALVGLAPENRFGLYWLVFWVIASRATWTGVITLRTTIWANNYPRADRTRIAAKLATLQSAVYAVVGVAAGLAMDWNEHAFHWLFPISALIGLLGVNVYRRVRLRGQKRLARHERTGDAHSRLSLNPLSVLGVLKHDPRYRRFMISMFIFGIGNLMLTAPLAIVLEEKFAVDYTTGILITTVIPSTLVPLLIPLWSPLHQRTHIIQFRTIHAWSYVSASLVFLVAALTSWLPLMYLAAALTGLGNAGGMLAWNLGHQDFAPPGRDSQYMSVHVTLTGIRGLLAPFLAVGIYEGLDAGALGAGTWVFAVCLALNVIGAIGFWRMAQTLPVSAPLGKGIGVRAESPFAR